jgi:hypothetical protein
MEGFFEMKAKKYSVGTLPERFELLKIRYFPTGNTVFTVFTFQALLGKKG